MSDDDWLDEELLADDVSVSGWPTRSVGVGRTKAMLGMPTFGILRCKVPIATWRVVQQHCIERHIGVHTFVRQAIGMRMVNEGVNPADIDNLLTARTKRARAS